MNKYQRMDVVSLSTLSPQDKTLLRLDRATLGTAVMFQAIYVRSNTDTVLEQASVKSLSQNESVVTFDTDKFAPFMSPWSIMACKRLSWVGTRTVSTGAIMGTRPAYVPWERD